MVDTVFSTPKDEHYFFGYYDKSSLDIESSRLLAQRSAFIDRSPESDDVLEIGYFNWQENNTFVKVSETNAWNWQQGCMLQWLGPKFKDKIIYNDCIDGKFVSIVMDIMSGEKSILDMPVYSVDSNGERALCVDFERLYWFRRGYSYAGVENHNKNIPIDFDSGIWVLDIESNQTSKIISLRDLMNLSPISCMEKAVHYVEHVMFSPNGERFCFLHRWQMEDGGIYSRVVTANIDGSEIHLLYDSGKASHFCWRDNHQILIYCGLKTSVNKLRKHKVLAKLFFKPLLPLYHKLFTKTNKFALRLTGNSYVLFNDRANVKTPVGTSTLLEDGHPTFNPINNNFFVTDTYPNKNNLVPLMIYDLSSEKLKIIDELKSIAEYDNSAERCDLHPRWSYDGKYVVIDTMDEGVRGMYVYHTEDVVK